MRVGVRVACAAFVRVPLAHQTTPSPKQQTKTTKTTKQNKGGGKTAITECLAAALTELGTKTVTWRMNPKALTAPQMFGRMDAATGDWTDGVFAVLWRRAAKAPKGQSTWIVLDGPVDAIWIENLNTGKSCCCVVCLVCVCCARLA